MHWPGANTMFYVSAFFTLIMIIVSSKWKFEYDNDTINLFGALKLLSPNLIFIYFFAFTCAAYGYLNILGIVPNFYSEELPPAVAKYMSEGDQNVEKSFKADELKTTYYNFIERSEKNGFLK